MNDKIIQITGFGVNNTVNTQCDYMLVGLTESGKVLICHGGVCRGGVEWHEVSSPSEMEE